MAGKNNDRDIISCAEAVHSGQTLLVEVTVSEAGELRTGSGIAGRYSELTFLFGDFLAQRLVPAGERGESATQQPSCHTAQQLAGDDGNKAGKTEHWRQMFEVNELSLAICSREAVEDIMRRGFDDGFIIHISR
ncbi:uncharacterized protein LOC124775930 [Schistocerca piceifrons]|uniref:uncharacterized protein LOC124775930 n=1 Tax=Schistocerca piceifrons TaxID=274613 RepID=UPI001F5EB295|nr:uncharacterized protein LOC124775930 [Schistocerca piceifrons]